MALGHDCTEMMCALLHAGLFPAVLPRGNHEGRSCSEASLFVAVSTQ